MKQSLSYLWVLSVSVACSAGSPVMGAHTGGAGGSAGAGGAPPNGGTAGAASGGTAAGAGTGGVANGGGGTGNGGLGGTTGAGAAGASGAAGAAGAGGSGPHGGSSNKAICTPGASYGDPLAGMGTIATINPPTSGTVTYFAFIEGPVWLAGQQKLFFSDNASSPQERIWSLTPPSTTPAVFMEMSGSNGMAVDNNDQLIIADQRNHRIARVDPTTAQVTGVVAPVGTYTPNDVVVRSNGSIYFTDPNSAGKGFYSVSPAGVVSSPMTQVGAPNGIELNADETLLYVGDVNAKTIYTFALAADGTVDTASKATFVTTMGNTVDGMATDCAGNLYAGTASGVEVYSSAKAYLGTIATGESSNCTFGGADRKTLYVTSRSVLKSVTLAVPGLPD